jgi:hypothetical protein
MSYVSPIEIPSKGLRRVAVMASRPLLVALALVALITAVRLTGTVDSDVAWQLWTAGRLHEGAVLYRDIIEVNPPLWFWMALPIDRIATLLHLRIESVLIVAIGCFATLSLAVTDRLLGLAPAKRVLWLTFAAVALLGIPWVHIGQREQIVLIASVPYAALVAARRQGQQVSAPLALIVGLIAAAGFALKHYFLIVPALLELWLILGQGRKWRWLRPETVAIVAIGVLYVTAVLLWAPNFLTDIVPLVGLSYGMLGAPSMILLLGPPVLVGLALLGVLAAHWRTLRDEAPVASALFVAALGFAAIYFIQAKGWIYHSIPLLGCASLAIAALLAESGAAMRFLRLAGPAMLAIPLVLTVKEQLNPLLPSPDLEAAIAGVKPGESVGFLSVETAIPWSVTLQHGFRYPSRYMGYWMLNAVVRNEMAGSPNARLTNLGRQVVSETVRDFSCDPPRRIIVPRPRPGEAGFDILPFFLRDPKFAAFLSHYRPISRTSLETYERSTPLAGNSPAKSDGSCATRFINHVELTPHRSSSMSRPRPRG